ncbi:hypothetical protein ScPMuIL_011370 [Solemya velum]
MVTESAREGDMWALEILESTGKISSSALTSTATLMGSFDECLSVTSHSDTAKTDDLDNNHVFRGQYCTLILFPDNKATKWNTEQVRVSVGLCVPDTCASSDISNLVSQELSSLNNSLLNHDARCQTREVEWDTFAIVVVVIIGLIALLITMATVYDTLGSHRPTPTFRDHESTAGCTWGQIMAAFSIYSNCSKLLSTERAPESIHCLCGIRVLSMCWVFLGHTYFFGAVSMENVVSLFDEIESKWPYQIIVQATHAVDSFFVLSGLLVSFHLLKAMKDNSGKINWLLYYLHRIVRLSPVYIAVMMTYVPLFKHIGSGPLWPQGGLEPQCKENWWISLLYLNNLLRVDRACMGWTWYLANDMQFYIISPLIVVPLFYFGFAGSVVSFVLLLASVITTGIISSANHISPSILGQSLDDTTGQVHYMSDYYIKPYCRIGPYIIGVLLGYILHKGGDRTKSHIHWLWYTLGWAVATAFGVSVIYGLYGTFNGYPLGNDVSAVYNALHSTCWGLALSWVVYACTTGHGGFVNTLLSWRGWVPLGRVTYCAFLIHPIVMATYYLQRRRLVYTTNLEMVFLFASFTTVVYSIAFAVTLVFESPMMRLEKLIFKKRINN